MAKILIVDDEPRIRELIREHLEHEGFQCEEATDGSAALAALAASAGRLVILDIMMPFVDGMTCLREMRKRKNRHARHHADGTRRGIRQACGPGGRRGRLCGKAVQPAGAGGPRKGGPGAHHAQNAGGRRKLCIRGPCHRHCLPQREDRRGGSSPYAQGIRSSGVPCIQ